MDDYGISSHVFGDVEEDFYAAVGRVPMLAALLEERLYDLLNAFHLEPQTKHAGTPGTALVKEIRKLLPVLPEAQPGDTYSLRGAVEQVLDDSDAVLALRHDVIHSVWPNPTLDAAFAWRSLPERSRKGSTEILKTFATTRGAFVSLCTEMVRVIDTIGRLLSQVEFEEVKRLGLPNVELTPDRTT